MATLAHRQRNLLEVKKRIQRDSNLCKSNNKKKFVFYIVFKNNT